MTVWRIPGGGSPDMGNVTADGTQLWLSGRYNGVVYVLSTKDGALLRTIPNREGFRMPPRTLPLWKRRLPILNGRSVPRR